MKIRSLHEFEAALDFEFGWRKQEITTLRLALKSARNHQLEVWFRSGIVLLYAHWEGLVRFSAKAYLTYIVNQGQTYKTMKPCFLFFAVRSKVDNSGKINLLNFEFFEKTRRLFSCPIDSKFDIDPQLYVSTREHQNLNSTEFKSLIGKLGLPYLTAYELREKLIDNQLMDYRNKVAHGESLHGEISDPEATFVSLADKVLDSLELLRGQLEDSLKNKLFLAN